MAQEGIQLAQDAEEELFRLRDTIEVYWVEIGSVMADIIDQKLYKYRQDENGNYFRTAKAYFEYLDRKFTERGWGFSRATLYRYADDYRLFVKELGVNNQDLITLGKSTIHRLAPGVRHLIEEKRVDDAKALVAEVVTAIEANEGLPLQEVDNAVDDATDRVMKSLAVEFQPTATGRKLKKLTLWWGGLAIDLMRAQLTEEQAQWVAKRLGNKLESDN